MNDSSARRPTTADPTPVGSADLYRGLGELGLTRGARIMVHSSLSSFGRFDGGADAVVEALISYLGPEGTILMPSFNHGAPFAEGGAGYYDPDQTPTTNGAIPEAFWRRSDVSRSLNPTHPIAAWGRDAVVYVSNHHRTLTMGGDSPLGRLRQDGGSIILIGVDYRANTFHHVVETVTGAPCLGRRTEELPVRLSMSEPTHGGSDMAAPAHENSVQFGDVPRKRIVNGRTWGWRNAPCPITDQNRYADLMVAQGNQRTATVGASILTCFVADDCYKVVAWLLAHGRDGYPPCSQCPVRPRTTSHTVESDWDEETGEPLPSSECWTY